VARGPAMPRRAPAGRIVAMGGGGFSMEPRNPRLDAFVLSLCRGRRPRIAFVPTASGDSPLYAARFLRAFRRHPCRPSVLSLFRPPKEGLDAFCDAQDAFYVGGGNTRNLLVLWRDRGLDAVLRRRWEEGAVLAGVSAGALCWFEEGLSDSVSPGRLEPLEALGWLRGSFCPHFDGEPGRRPALRRLLAAGRMRPGWACDDGAAVVYRGTAFEGAVASRPGARVVAVSRGRGGESEERVGPVRVLS
jgi:dipeptidase E